MARLGRSAALIAAAVLVAAFGLGRGSAEARTLGRWCDGLAAVDGWSYCFHTSGTPGATVYSTTRTHDGVHWANWPITLAGITGELQVQYFGHLAGGTWYLQEYNHGLYSSSDGHTFSALDPAAINGQLNGSETSVGTFQGKAALLLANSGGAPAVVPEGLPAVPIAGLGGETSLLVPGPGGTVWALGRTPTQEADPKSPMSLAPCDALLLCVANTAPIAHATSVAASAPAGTPKVIVLNTDNGSGAVYLAGPAGLHQSGYLSHLLGSLHTGPSIQVGWAAASATDWFVRVGYPPNTNSRTLPGPGDLIIEGNPQTDRWKVVSYAPSEWTPHYRQFGGTRAPWTSPGTCVQPSGYAITWTSAHQLIAQFCVATSAWIYRSADHGHHWRLVPQTAP